MLSEQASDSRQLRRALELLLGLAGTGGRLSESKPRLVDALKINSQNLKLGGGNASALSYLDQVLAEKLPGVRDFPQDLPIAAAVFSMPDSNPLQTASRWQEQLQLAKTMSEGVVSEFPWSSHVDPTGQQALTDAIEDAQKAASTCATNLGGGDDCVWVTQAIATFTNEFLQAQSDNNAQPQDDALC